MISLWISEYGDDEIRMLIYILSHLSRGIFGSLLVCRDVAFKL